ncbi:MAG: MATE family efflux transporter [Prevotellaceae bacterium]|nr:MATE family efflux transporter [Candidatus Minthosoma caballi]
MQEEKKSPKELGTAPIGKLLTKYAIPAVIAMTCSSLYNMIDRIFIGHIPEVGTLSLGGLAVTFPIVNLSAAFGAMVGVGASTMISIKLGQKDYPTAQRVLGNLVSLNIIIGILIGTLGIIFIDPLLLFFGASENTICYAHDYMFIILMGNVITHLYLGLNSAIRSTGHPHVAMIATVSGVVINACFDPLFIFVFNLGIEGAAYATILSQIISLIFVVCVLSNKKELIHLHSGIYGLRKNIVKHIITIGMSPFCMQLCACLVVILINKGLTKHGGDTAIAAYGIVNGITFIFIMVVLGICQGMQPIAGFNYGAQKPERVNAVLKKAIILATIVMTCSFLLCEFFPQYPVSLFTDDAELTAICVRGMRIIVAMTPVVGFQIVVGNFFQSIGMAKQSIFQSVARQLVFLVPFLLIFPEIWGTDGVWLSITAADGIAAITSAVMLVWFYRKQKGSYKKVSEVHARSIKHRIAYFFSNRVTP